jgi:hypothetical protein
MRALIKNSKKIVINQVDPSERALIDDFVRKSLKQVTTLRSLYDIDNELDGVSFELTGQKPGAINFKTPCIQVLAVEGTIAVDLNVDSETTIEVEPDENEEFLKVSLNENREIEIKALYKEELLNTTGQYIVTVVLEKPGYDTTIIPINVSVLYFDSDGTKNYEELYNLPKINNKTLLGNRELSELGIQEEIDPISNADIDKMFS